MKLSYSLFIICTVSEDNFGQMRIQYKPARELIYALYIFGLFFNLFNYFFVLFKEPISFFGIFVGFVCLGGSTLVWAFLKAI